MILSNINVPLLTPFCSDGKINYSEYEHLIDYVTANNVNGVFVGGTSGEFANLTLSERIEQLKVAKKAIPSNTKLLFNVAALNPEDFDTLVNAAYKAGVDAISVTAPYYHRYDSKSLLKYFQYVNDHSLGLPVYLYNMNTMTQNPITPELLDQIIPACRSWYFF
jgi:dihydrodipicolinate synthase/N-acetylneuraminate lyase